MGRLVYKRWLETANKNPLATVIEDSESDLRISFRQLQEEIHECSHKLQQMGAVRNRIVACQVPNSSAWMAIFLACQALDAIAMAIDPDVPLEAFIESARSVGASVIWTQAGLSKMDKGSRRDPGCLIKLTSGTTGNPRPLFFTDSQMLADGQNIMKSMGITATDSNLATIPFGHSYGLGNIVMPCILEGCPIHICNDPYPHALASVVRNSNPSIYPTVPALIRPLVRSQVDPSDLQSIRLWISAGSVLNPEDAKRFHKRFGKIIHNFYGSSETGGIAYDQIGEDTLTGRSVGKPLDGVKCFLSSSNRLVVESRAVFTRYNPRRHNHPGQHLLPDRASVLKDGSIQLKGRLSRIEKIGGKRLSLVEIEKYLMKMDEIEACHVDIYKDSNQRTKLGAVIISDLPIEAVQSNLKAVLPPWKIPVRWIRLDAMPTNARGKLNQNKIRQIIAKGTLVKGKP